VRGSESVTGGMKKVPVLRRNVLKHDLKSELHNRMSVFIIKPPHGKSAKQSKAKQNKTITYKGINKQTNKQADKQTKTLGAYL